MGLKFAESQMWIILKLKILIQTLKENINMYSNTSFEHLFDPLKFLNHIKKHSKTKAIFILKF